MTNDATPELSTRFRARRRAVAGVGIVGVAVCFALAFSTRERFGDPTRDRSVGELVSGGGDRLLPDSPGDPGGGRDGSRLPLHTTPSGSATTRGRRPLRVRVTGETSAIVGAIVRIVAFDREAQTTIPLSESARTGSDGVADLFVDERAPSEAWIEVAEANERGMRHGFRRFAFPTRRDGELEISIPGSGRLEIHVEGLPAELMPPYVDVRFLTPDGGWEELFTDLPATPIEDGGLFENRAIPRVQRVPLHRDGTAAVPEVPGDHGIYVEFPEHPEGFIVETSEFSGCSVPATRGAVCRIAEGSTGVYRVRFRTSPSAHVRVEDERGEPIAGAEVAVGIRQANEVGITRVFDSTSATAATGIAEVPLWTGTHLPDWTPAGLVIVASAPDHTSRVLETAGGWYGQDATLRLGPAKPGSFVLEGTLAYPDGRRAAGIPVRIAAAAPWNGDSALPRSVALTDDAGAWRIEVPEAHRPVYAYGRRIRLEIDGERLEAQSRQAVWRKVCPDLPRATTLPADFEIPAPDSSARHDVTIVLPPS